MPPQVTDECASAWEEDWFPHPAHAPRNLMIRYVQREYVQRRLRNWTDRLTAYWVGLPGVRKELWIDAQMLRAAEEEAGERVERFMLKHAPDQCDYVKFNYHMEAQRVARMGREFHGFLHLPPEVRRLIYGYLLVVGDVFVPNSHWSTGVESLKRAQLYKYCDYPYYRYRHYNNSTVSKDAQHGYAPALIQGVCKTIQREAWPTFFAQNRFIFSYGLPTFPISFSGQFALGWKADYMDHARDLSYTFDWREGRRRPGTDYSGPASDFREVRKHANWLGHTTEARNDRAHSIHADQDAYMEESWCKLCQRLKEKTKLKRLQLDFEECYCPLGCCRKVESVCASLRELEGKWQIAMPEVIEIVGWCNDNEKAQIRAWLHTLMGPKGVRELNFVGQSIEIWDMFNDPDEDPLL